MGGKPSKGTSADKRLAQNKPKAATATKPGKATMPSGAAFGKKGK